VPHEGSPIEIVRDRVPYEGSPVESTRNLVPHENPWGLPGTRLSGVGMTRMSSVR